MDYVIELLQTKRKDLLATASVLEERRGFDRESDLNRVRTLRMWASQCETAIAALLHEEMDGIEEEE